MTTTLNADDMRQRLITKLTDAVSRAQGSNSKIAATATYDALQQARGVAKQGLASRLTSIGFCDGVRKTLDALKDLTHVEPYTRALEVAGSVLATNTLEQVEAFNGALQDAVVGLMKVKAGR